jgi:alanine racemase
MLALADALKKAGADGFCVATVAEGLDLRQSIGADAKIVVLQGAENATAAAACVSQRLEMIVQNENQMGFAMADSWPSDLPVWLKCDTGMHRLGMGPARMRACIPRAESKFGKSGFTICSHFACADEVGLEFNSEQLAVLRGIQKEFDVQNFSMANSGGIMTIPAAHGTYNRLGYMLYGNSPLQNRPPNEFPLRPAMRVTAPVIALRDVPVGESVGYARKWYASRPSRIATVSIGYGDGYPRSATSGVTPVLVGGRRASLVGRVSMDSITIDVTDMGVSVGDEVCLWGDASLLVDEVAETCGTIGYELLTRMPSRIQRVYVEDGDAA